MPAACLLYEWRNMLGNAFSVLTMDNTMLGNDFPVLTLDYIMLGKDIPVLTLDYTLVYLPRPSFLTTSLCLSSGLTQLQVLYSSDLTRKINLIWLLYSYMINEKWIPALQSCYSYLFVVVAVFSPSMMLQDLPLFILTMSVMLMMRSGILTVDLLATADTSCQWSGQG